MRLSRAETGRQSAGDHRASLLPQTLRLGVVLLCLVAVPGGSASCADVGLSGTWAGLKILSDSATFPLVGGVARTTTLVQRLAIAQAGSALIISGTYCAADFDNGPSLTTVIDPEFVCSLDAVVVEGSVDASSTPTRFAQSWSTELHGVRLDDPEGDSLPTSAGDPRVFDQDRDGKPGITVHACAFGGIIGDVYVVERLRTRLEGEAVSPDRIEGRVEGTVEQVILGATNALFLGAIASRPDPISAHSYFVLQRIEPAWTCEEILDHRASLFGG